MKALTSTVTDPRELDGPIVSRPRNQKNGKSLDQYKDETIGKIGTFQREIYETELKMEIIQELIRDIRKKRNLSQQELGDKLGVKKSHISKLEKGYSNTSIALLTRVFVALNAKIKISVELDETEFELV